MPKPLDNTMGLNIYSASIECEIVKILAPLTDNPNASDEDGQTPMYWAAHKGHTKIVKILTPLTNNPNGWIFLIVGAVSKDC